MSRVYKGGCIPSHAFSPGNTFSYKQAQYCVAKTGASGSSIKASTSGSPSILSSRLWEHLLAGRVFHLVFQGTDRGLSIFFSHFLFLPRVEFAARHMGCSHIAG